MNRKSFIQAAALALILSTSTTAAVAQTAAPSKSKVVFQISDGDAGKWNMALNNAKNVQQELGADKVDIQIVAYGPGIGMLKADATTNSRVMEAAKSGVKMVACENTMTVQKISKADMNPVISYVPSGVVELMRLHSEGWAYIRP